ncbi:MAG: hypothetical protein K2O15_08040 [Lachnospiraceae bacterium]|nr:hypothetical protein [Lachnospiraceae bacterium]
MTNTDLLQQMSDLIDEKLQDMKEDMQGMKEDMQGMKEDMQGMKEDMQGMKEDMQGMKEDMRGMKEDMRAVKADIYDLQRKVSGIGMHVENFTDKNVQLIAENFIELTKKLNMAIPAADNNRAYEVKVNYLLEEVDKIKKAIEERSA